MDATIELEHAIGCTTLIPNSVFYHPNGKDIVYISGACVVICDLKDPHSQDFLRGHDDNITCVAISKTGAFLASGQLGENADVCVWDFASRKMIHRLNEHDNAVASVSFSDDERLLLTIGNNVDKRLLIWDLKSGYLVANSTLASSSKIASVWGGFVRDVKRRATKDYQFATTCGQNVLLWQLDPMSGALKFTKANCGGLIREHSCIAFSCDGEYIYTGTASGELNCIHVRNNALHSTFPVCAQGVQSLIISTTDKLIVGGGDGSITRFKGKWKDFVDEKKISLAGAVTSLSFSPDCESFIAATTEGDVHLCITNTLSHTAYSQNHKGPVQAICFLPESNEKFATIAHDNTVRFWDISNYSMKCKTEFKGNASPVSLCFISDIIVTGWSDGSVRSVDSETGEILWNIAKAHRSSITCLKPSHNLKFFITGDQDGEVRVWDVKTKEMVCQFKEHRGAITDLYLFNDDMHVLSSSKDRSIFYWDLKRERRLSAHTQKMGSINSITVSSDQTQILSVGSNKQITNWDIRQPDPVLQFAYHSTNAFEPRCIELSHNNDFFAIGGSDENVNLYDYKSMKLIKAGEGHSGTVHDLKFSEDDKQIVSVGNDGCIFVWNVFT